MTAAKAIRRVQAVFQRIVEDLDGAQLRAEPSEEPGLHPGRSASLSIGGDRVGILGELSFETAAAFEIRGRVAVGELRIDAIAPSPPRRQRYAQPPRFPAIVQDLAVTVPADRRAGDALDAIRDAHAAAARDCGAVRRVSRPWLPGRAGRDGRSG